MKKATLLLLLSFFFLGSIDFQLNAQDTYQVNYDFLNFRKGPGTQHEIIKTLDRNAVVILVKKGEADWWKVNHLGVFGYVSAIYLVPINLYEVNYKYLNVRQGPNTNHKKLKKLKRGDQVEVLKRLENSWWEIRHKGETGFVSSIYLSPSNGQIAETKAGKKPKEKNKPSQIVPSKSKYELELIASPSGPALNGIINQFLKSELVFKGGTDVLVLPEDVVTTLYLSGSLKDEDFMKGKAVELSNGIMIPSSDFYIENIQIEDLSIDKIRTRLAKDPKSPIIIGDGIFHVFEKVEIDFTNSQLVLD